MGWKFLDTGKRAAAENMALDAALLMDLEEELDPVLHFYDWEGDAATYGHFIDPEKFLNIKTAEKMNLDLARRPTGGGIVFHNCDLAFSVLVPAGHPFFSQNPLENYALVNNRVIWALQQLKGWDAKLLAEEPKPMTEKCFSFCMAKPTKYDVMIKGKKVGGAAQRKTRHGFLHQGSISLGFLPETYLREVLACEAEVIEAMKQNSFSLLGDKWTKKDLETVRKELGSLLKKAFGE